MFVAQLIETYGALEGATLEPVRLAGLEELSALVSGDRRDLQVKLTKAYDAASDLGLVPISYTGFASSDLNRLQGEWRALSRDPLAGGFAMRRISTHPAFSLRGREEPVRTSLSAYELRGRQAAIRRQRVSIAKPRRPRPKGPLNRA